MITIVGGLVVAMVSYFVFGIGKTSGAPYIEVDTNNGIIQTGASSTAIQNINHESSYVWSNVESWRSSRVECSEENCTAAYLLSFNSLGSVAPLHTCLTVISDVRLVAVSLSPWAPRKEVSYELEKLPYDGVARICPSDDMGRAPTFNLQFASIPSFIKAELTAVQD